MGSLGSVTSLQSLASYRPVRNTTHVVVKKDDEGNKIINDYSIIGDLGKGAQAKVKLGLHIATDKVVAIKIINKSMIKAHQFSPCAGLQIDRLRAEIAIMKKMRHKNVVQLHEVIDDPDANKLYLVMQYVEDGPFFKIEKDGTCPKFSEDEVALYLRQILSGTQYLHRHGIIHRDLKPDNILRGKNGDLFLADFGVSEMVEGDDVEISGIIGTPLFFSPELCRREGKVHGKAVDVWAIGVILFAMLFGKLPFFGSTVEEICSVIQNSSLTIPKTCSAPWRDAVMQLLDKDPTRRITLPELREHECLRGVASPSRSRSSHSISSSVNERTFEILQVNEDEVSNAVHWGSNIEFGTAKFARFGWVRYRIHRYLKHIRRRIAERDDVTRRGSGSTRAPASLRASLVGSSVEIDSPGSSQDDRHLPVHPQTHPHHQPLSPQPPSARPQDNYHREHRSHSPARALVDELHVPDGASSHNPRRLSNHTVAIAREEESSSSLLEEDLVFKHSTKVHRPSNSNVPVLPKIPKKPGRRVQKLSTLASGGLTNSMHDLVGSGSAGTMTHQQKVVPNTSRVQQSVHSTFH
jgi:serine/threonine protein kinase